MFDFLFISRLLLISNFFVKCKIFVYFQRKTQQSDVDQKLVKKLTFKCDGKISPIPENQDSITKSGSVSAPIRQSSRKRVHRKGKFQIFIPFDEYVCKLCFKGVHSRHRRRDHNVNENQDTGLANSQMDGSQNLLTVFGQKKKRMNWCCFL